MTTLPIVELRNVTFTHTGTTTPILNQIHVQMGQDQRIGIIGPNGCGKTTLLHLLVGLHRPTSGTLLFKGNPVTCESEYTTLRKSIGLVFQDADDQLFSPTVLEDVAFGPLNLGLSIDKALDISLKTLAKLELSDLADRVTHNLSGGEKKLVSLATILSMQPEAMLLDEPSNNLDPITRARLIHIIQTLNIACMIISHDWDFLAATCDTLYALDDGYATQSDTSCLHVHRHAHTLGDHPHIHEE